MTGGRSIRETAKEAATNQSRASCEGSSWPCPLLPNLGDSACAQRPGRSLGCPVPRFAATDARIAGPAPARSGACANAPAPPGQGRARPGLRGCRGQRLWRGLRAAPAPARHRGALGPLPQPGCLLRRRHRRGKAAQAAELLPAPPPRHLSSKGKLCS